MWSLEFSWNSAFAPHFSSGSACFHNTTRALHFASLGICVDLHLVSGMNFTIQEVQRQRILKPTLYSAFHGTRAVGRVVAFAEEQGFSRRSQLNGQLALGETFGQIAHLHFDDALDLIFSQGAEHHDVVNSIQELRTEKFPQSAHGLFTRLFRIFLGEFENCRRADVGGHDDYGVAKIHGAAFAIGQAAVVKNLKQNVENIRMRLFDFVQQNHRIRTAANLFRELSAFFIAYVARRRADHSRDRMFLHVFGHVETDDSFLVVEQKFSESAGELGLAYSSWAEEQE